MSPDIPTITPNGSKIRHMKASHGGREAKEFLIFRIVEEAQKEKVPLSEVERKMLYFTESGWTLPDITKVSEDFDGEYDQGEYEKKIAKLVAKAYKQICNGPREDYDRWWSAIHFLQREDHYILVMIRLAGLRPRGDQLRLFATALGIATTFFIGIFVAIKYNLLVPGRGQLENFVWAVAACLFVVYMVLRFVLGRKRADDLASTLLQKLVRMCQRVSRSA